jgi:hypothetical protein
VTSGLIEPGMSARRSRQFSRREREHKDESRSQSRARASQRTKPVRLARARGMMTRAKVIAHERGNRMKAKERRAIRMSARGEFREHKFGSHSSHTSRVFNTVYATITGQVAQYSSMSQKSGRYTIGKTPEKEDRRGVRSRDFGAFEYGYNRE